jgi:hypothetical protein
VVGQRLARRRLQPLRELRRATRSTVACARAGSSRRSRTGTSSATSQTQSRRSFLLAQRLAQLALQVQVLLAARVAGAARHADQQPLALQRRQRHRLAVEQRGGRDRGSGRCGSTSSP